MSDCGCCIVRGDIVMTCVTFVCWSGLDAFLCPIIMVYD